jgi:hypothetical protein
MHRHEPKTNTCDLCLSVPSRLYREIVNAEPVRVCKRCTFYLADIRRLLAERKARERRRCHE